MTHDELVALIILSRQIEWRYRLDQYEAVVLKELLMTVKRAEQEILKNLDSYAATLPQWAEDRALGVLDELSDLTLGIQSVLYNNILELASVAGAASYLAHNNILSFDGRVPAYNYVSLTADQLRSVLVDTPVGGKLLNEWTLSVYSSKIEDIRHNILTGLLKGDDYRQFVGRLTSEFDMVRTDAATLAKTYVQSVNVSAQDATYRANEDIITGVKWTATLESGYKRTGRGTCLRCAALDGKVFPLKGPKPECPLHPNCRCLYLPELVTWRELGINIDEIEDAYRPYTIRPDKPIGTGGRRTIIEHGLHGGDYSTWFADRPQKFKKDLVGPKRLELLNSGKISFGDLVDQTGRLRLLSEFQ